MNHRIPLNRAMTAAILCASAMLVASAVGSALPRNVSSGVREGNIKYTEQVLYTFGPDIDRYPGGYGHLIADADGALYGVTVGDASFNGMVFRLSPPDWSETLLYQFTPEASHPLGTLLANAHGTLYGVTQNGGISNYGVVYELLPPTHKRSTWTLEVLHEFSGDNDGVTPAAGLTTDGSGNLYGTTTGGGRFDSGVAYRLSPPSAGRSNWKETVLYDFGRGNDGRQPSSGLMLSQNGDFYGTTFSGGTFGRGTVYSLTPPSSGKNKWTETVLNTFRGNVGFNPMGGVVQDSSGNLYGVNSAGGFYQAGTAWMLSPVAGKTRWRLTAIHHFGKGGEGATPQTPLTLDSDGNVYGTTLSGSAGCGNVFELVPRNGRRSWSERELHGFPCAFLDGANPEVGPLLINGRLYGTTRNGGSQNVGVAYSIAL